MQIQIINPEELIDKATIRIMRQGEGYEKSQNFTKEVYNEVLTDLSIVQIELTDTQGQVAVVQVAE